MRLLRYMVWLVLFSFSGCDAVEKNREMIEHLEESADRKYEVGLACMQYILKHGEDLAYSKSLVRKLQAIGFPDESINATESLLRRHPKDADLHYLRAMAYRRQHQYELSRLDLERAIELQPRNEAFIREMESMNEEYHRWLQIESLNHSLSPPADSFNILLSRANHFLTMKEYDAVLYDLGSISKMRAPEDSIYYQQKVLVLYKQSHDPVSTLKEIFDYFGERTGTQSAN